MEVRWINVPNWGNTRWGSSKVETSTDARELPMVLIGQDVSYDAMKGTFDTTGGTARSQTLSLNCNASYTIYARCMDMNGNKNTSSTPISFRINAPPPPTLPPAAPFRLKLRVTTP